jgi:RNA polymerase sigma-70 factor (ECF subfamily)
MGLRRLAPPSEPTFDADAIDACRRGDLAAIGAVLRDHTGNLERLLGRIVGSSSEVEDLLQDTFEAAVRGFASYRGKAPIGAWLAAIAVRVAYRHLRRPERTRRIALELVVEPATHEHANPIEEGTSERRIRERIYHHLAAVSAKNRIAFVLHVIEERPIAEVAALMGATQAATKSRVFLARRKLEQRAGGDPMLRGMLFGRTAR